MISSKFNRIQRSQISWSQKIIPLNMLVKSKPSCHKNSTGVLNFPSVSCVTNGIKPFWLSIAKSISRWFGPKGFNLYWWWSWNLKVTTCKKIVLISKTRQKRTLIHEREWWTLLLVSLTHWVREVKADLWTLYFGPPKSLDLRTWDPTVWGPSRSGDPFLPCLGTPWVWCDA